MVLYTQHDVQISRRAAIQAGMTLPGEQNLGAIFDPRRDLNGNGFFAQRPSLSFATGARIGNHSSGATALCARASHAEETLLKSNLPPAPTSATGGGRVAGLGACAITMLASG